GLGRPERRIERRVQLASPEPCGRRGGQEVCAARRTRQAGSMPGRRAVLIGCRWPRCPCHVARVAAREPLVLIQTGRARSRFHAVGGMWPDGTWATVRHLTVLPIVPGGRMGTTTRTFFDRIA